MQRVQCEEYSAVLGIPCRKYTTKSTGKKVHFLLQREQCRKYNGDSTEQGVQCREYSADCTLFTVRSSVYQRKCSLTGAN
jgi:hypothetical protein